MNCDRKSCTDLDQCLEVKSQTSSFIASQIYGFDFSGDGVDLILNISDSTVNMKVGVSATSTAIIDNNNGEAKLGMKANIGQYIGGFITDASKPYHVYSLRVPAGVNSIQIMISAAVEIQSDIHYPFHLKVWSLFLSFLLFLSTNPILW